MKNSRVERSLLVVLAAALVLTSCSSVRLRSESVIQLENGQSATHDFEKSYDLGSIPVLCGVSAIFFGGACWYYLVLPTVNQKTELRQDADRDLERILGGKTFSYQEQTLGRAGWGVAPVRSKLEGVAQGPSQNP